MDTKTDLVELQLEKKRLQKRMEAIRKEDRRCPPLRRPLTGGDGADPQQLRKQIGFLKAWLGAYE